MAAQDYYNSFNANHTVTTPHHPPPDPPPSYYSSSPNDGHSYNPSDYKPSDSHYWNRPSYPNPAQQLQAYAPPQPAQRPGNPEQYHSSYMSQDSYRVPRPQAYHQSNSYRPAAPARLYTDVSHLRPQRSTSEPPSPDNHRRHSKHHSHSRHDSPGRSGNRQDRARDDRDREDRPRRKHRHSHSHSHHSRAKSPDHTTRNTFLGAGGGAIIGDAVFPGLGTLGAALLGGFVGHEAGRKGGSGSGRSGGGSSKGRRNSYDVDWEEGRRRRGEIPRS